MTRRRQRGWAGMLAITIGVLALVGLLAVCTPGEDDHSLGRIQLVSHEYGGDCDWDGNCGRYDDGYGRGGDGGESGGHQGYGGGGGRSGDYDGGDGDGDRCRNICNNTFPIVPSPGDGGQG